MTAGHFFWLAFLAVPVLVYWDTTYHKIGKVEGQKGLVNQSAGQWAFTFLVINFIAWPLYLVNRGKLIARAKEHPVDLTITHRILVTLLLLVFPFFGAFTYSSEPLFSQGSEGRSGLPLCDTARGRADVDSAIANAPLGRVSGISIIKYKNIETLNSTPFEVRCKADALLNTSETQPVIYSFTVEDNQVMVRFQYDHKIVSTEISTTAPAQCFEEGEKTTVNGTISRETFPGPPNYESIDDGDQPETVWIITVSQPQCVMGTDEETNKPIVRAKAETRFQLMFSHDEYTKYPNLPEHSARVTGQIMAAWSGHHHTKALIDVETLVPLQN